MLRPLESVNCIEDSDEDEVQDEVKAEQNKSSSSESFYSEEEVVEEEIIEEEKLAEEKSEVSLNGAVQAPEESMSVQQPKPRRKRFIPKYEVDGVYKIVLGEETQIQIDMVVGTHVNAQYPWKMVSKAKILQTIETGGELSEFFPIREFLENYDGQDILMGYIVDESNDIDEFYVCCTIEARDHCKEQSDHFIRRQEKKLEKAVQKKPKPWQSLGSEKEILELVPTNTRPLMEMEIKARFPKEYEPKKFHVRDTISVRDGYIELTTQRQKFSNIYRKRVDRASQIAPFLVNRSAQTVLKYPQNMWTQSIADALGKLDNLEGGGGGGGGGDAATATEGDNKEGDIDSEEEEGDEEEEREKPDEAGLASFRAAFKRMRRPSYIKLFNGFLSQKRDEMNSIVELNTVMDIYCNDYPNLVTEKSVDTYDSMIFEEYVCFTDVRAKDKNVSSAVFHPMWSGIVAICYSDGSPTVMKSLSSRADPIQRAVYGLNPVLIWSHVDSLIPKLYLESPREVKTLSFCPFNENILVGGCINGQIIIWDLTNKLENVEKIEVLSETREKYRIGMNAHMGWMKNVQDNAVVQSTALSNLITSHYAAVTSIQWLSPNFVVTMTGRTEKLENTQSLMFFSGSEDGNILIWNLSIENVASFEGRKVKKSKRILKRPSALMVDISPLKILDRNLQPCFKIIMGQAGMPHVMALQALAIDGPKINYIYAPRNTGSGRKYFTCEILPQSVEDISTNLYCGSQHGEMRRVSWEGHKFNTGEVVNSEYSEIKYSCSIHDGIISCTQKNPFINQITMTVGGKIFAIWSDKLLHRPLIWKKRPYRLTDGKWSLYKPSILFIATSEGDLETWDLLLRSDKPISIQTLSGSMLTGVSLHSLPIAKNIIGVSDTSGSFRMFLVPPIFLIENNAYNARMESMIYRELKVMHSFINWQDEWKKNNPQILLEMKRKEGALLAAKEEERRKHREEEIQRLEEEAEARRLAKLRVIGPEERWQNIIQKLIEKTIAVKKRINREELIEHEKPLRELEAQRLEKEKRMLEIMKNQKTIFNDTVAILFPEAIKKQAKIKKSLLSDDREGLKKEYLEDYFSLKAAAQRTVNDNPYKVSFSWDATLAEGYERRQALNPYDDYVKLHKTRIEDEVIGGTIVDKPPPVKQVSIRSVRSSLRLKTESESEFN